jgi:anaerobic selenocysteine-containing dehydrogenase
MTNGWIDMKNTDMMLIMGGNPAENHPCGFKWPVEAKRNRNAKMIVVDPRFTRTASQADVFCQIRAGSDLAFLGGLISYAIRHNRVAHEYLVNYTNAAFIVKDGFKLPEDGLFSGFDPATKSYDKATWNYEEGGNETPKVVVAPGSEATAGQESHGKAAAAMHAAGDHPQGSNAHNSAEGQGHQAAGPMGAKAVAGAAPPPPSLPRMSPTISRCKIRAASFSY